MRAITTNSGFNLLKEQFVPDHVFLYVVKGEITFYDGHDRYSLGTGECGIARKNNLVKFKVKEGFEPILFCFDEPFLQSYQSKHAIPSKSNNKDALIKISHTAMIPEFISSIKPYYKGVMELDEAFEDLKYEELLIILLKNQPELSGLFFDFALPGKIGLEAFMNRNYRFNVSLERFAFLTGRSLSAFKRDFKVLFNDTPSHWLMRKRLQEAYVLMDEKHQKPSEFYLDLGFESLSHFSTAFKKQFGHAPSRKG